MARLIDKEVKDLIDRAYERTKNLLIKHKEELKKLAELLLKKEVVYKVDLEKILGKRNVEIVHESKE